jgi:hypothetical protein
MLEVTTALIKERQVKFVEAKQLADRHGLQYF